MATRMELPTKRENSVEKEQEASKKAKREEAASSDDEIMLDSLAEEEALKEAKREVEARKKKNFAMRVEATKKAMKELEEAEKAEEELRSKCRALEYKIFFRVHVDPARAEKISFEEDAHTYFSDQEREMFWSGRQEKVWIMRPTPGSFDDYQRLAIYYSKKHRFYRYVHLYYPYDFDRKYQKFTQELNVSVKWDATYIDVQPIAEIFWKRHLSVPIDPMLIDESIDRATSLSCAIQSAKELHPLFLNIYRREAAGVDFLQALKEIIGENGLECYPKYKVEIKKALEEEEGSYTLMVMNDCFKRRIKMFIDYQCGEPSVEDVEDVIRRYFEIDPLKDSGSDYIDYVKKKIMVAHDLKILTDDDLVLE